jgi:hypothetical protein
MGTNALIDPENMQSAPYTLKEEVTMNAWNGREALIKTRKGELQFTAASEHGCLGALIGSLAPNDDATKNGALLKYELAAGSIVISMHSKD